jgi:branched-chain amino acid transport system substrate-binding protein
MKRSTVLRILTGLLVMTLVLSGCVAPGGAPAPAGDEPAAESGDTGGEDAAALECTDEIGCVEIAPDEPIHVAYMLTISGATAFLGEDSRGGVEIAIDDRGGELLGHEIELTGEDSGCSAEGGQTAAQKVAADPSILGIIGTSCSSAGTAALPIISQAGLVMISPSNTAPSLTSDNADEGGVWQPGYYRTGHNDLFQGRIAAEYMFNELGATTLATIHDGSPYADGLQAVAAQVFQELGGEVTFQGAVNVGDTDMRPILTELASNPPDVLYFPIFEPEGDLIAAQSREIAGLEEVTLMGADGLLADSFPEGTGDAADGMYLTGPYVAGDAYADLLAKWETKFGGSPPSGFHAHAYDATNMLLDAIEQAAQVGDDGTILVGRQALRDALNATSGFAGVTGSLTCGPTGDCATGEAIGVYQISMEEITGGNWPPAVVWTPGEASE